MIQRRGIDRMRNGLDSFFAIGLRLCALCLVAVCFFALVPFEAAVAGTVSEQPAQGTVRILFVGNSFTHCSNGGVAETLVGLARANGKDVDAQRVTFGGASLDQYAQPVTGVKKRYTTFEGMLTKKRWDYVVLQEKTKHPVTNPVEMYCSIRNLAKRITAAQPQAEVLLYMTHGFDNGSVTTVNGANRVLSASALSAYVQSYYSCVGKKLGLRVVPVGKYYERYRSTTGAFPNKLVGADSKHPSAAGFFLIASACYEAVFGEPPHNPIPDLEYLSVDEQYELYSMMGTTFVASPSYLALSVGQKAKITPVSTIPADEDEPITPDDPGEGETSDDPDTEGSTDVPGDGGDPAISGDQGGTGASEEGSESPAEPIQVSYSSLDPDIASVDATGTITARKAGKTAVVLRAANGEKAACYISVEAGKLLSSKIVLPKSSVKITAGEEVTLIPQVSEFLGAYALKWSTGNKRVASVSALGTVKGVGAGKTKITVRDVVSGRSASYTIKVRLKAPKTVTVARMNTELYGKTRSALKVKWSSVKGAKSYKVYRTIGDDGPAKLVGKTKKRTFVDTKVVLNRVVSYSVVALNGKSSQKSLKSDKVEGIALSKANLTASETGDKPKLSWDERHAADGYLLYRAPGKKGAFKRVARLKSSGRTSWTDKEAEADKSYRYKMRSYRKIGGKTFSSAYSETVLVKVPKASDARLKVAAADKVSR